MRKISTIPKILPYGKESHQNRNGVFYINCLFGERQALVIRRELNFIAAYSGVVKVSLELLFF